MNSLAKLSLTDNYGQVFLVTAPSAQIGSGSQCTIVLDEPGVLDIHAEFYIQDGSWMLRDVTGENSVIINGEKIQTMHKISNGDVISIGGAVLKVTHQETQAIASQQSEIEQQSSSADLSEFRSDGGAYIANIQPEENRAAANKPCRACGQLIHPEAEICPHCGVRQTAPPMPAPKVGKKSKGTAVLLAILLGGIGAHKFYLGQPVLGLLYLVFSWTGVPLFLGFFEGLYYLSLSDEIFLQKYG